MESSCVEDTVTISFEIKAFLETLRLDSLRKRVHPLFSHGKKQIKKLMDPWRRDLALSYNVSFVEHLLLAMAQRKIVNDNILICNHTFSRPDLRVERWYSWPLDEPTRMILNFPEYSRAPWVLIKHSPPLLACMCPNKYICVSGFEQTTDMEYCLQHDALIWQKNYNTVVLLRLMFFSPQLEISFSIKFRVICLRYDVEYSCDWKEVFIRIFCVGLLRCTRNIFHQFIIEFRRPNDPKKKWIKN